MLNKNNKQSKRSLGKQIIIFSTVFLMTLPWLGYRYVDEMKDFLIQGQSDAQLLAASAIATVLHNRSDLFNLTNMVNGQVIDGQTVDRQQIDHHSLYVYPLKHKLTIDGYGSDWNEVLSQSDNLNSQSLENESNVYYAPDSNLSYTLLLGEYEKYLYGLIRVNDDTVVYRHPGYARLNNSDQVRIELIDNNDNPRRFLLLTEAPGNVSVYEMQLDWKTPLTGKPKHALTGIWRDTIKGYDLEFRLPKQWIDKHQRLLISVVDINNEKERQINQVLSTMKNQTSNALNKLIIRSAELDRILKGLSYADANICIVDRYTHIRAVLGQHATENSLCSSKDKVSAALIEQSLSGKSSLHQRSVKNKSTIIIASQPIYQDEKIIGAVLVEKNSQNILRKQHASLNQIIIATVIVFIAALAGLLLFSSLLAYRLRRLQREVSSAIDEDGRLVKDIKLTDKHAKDELGELSRGFSNLLSQLKRYTGFLESIPRTLRHEILNPLNTISMTLQKMSSEKHFDKKLINSANKAIRQLELIVHSLTEAAHIEDALSHDDKINFDVAELLSQYVSNIRLKHINNTFTYNGPSSGVYMLGNDSRITQLLDKLKDNAIDFSIADTDINFELITNHNQMTINIDNKGPLIPDNVLKSLCHNIMSHRQGASKKPHLGIGIYVASRIASYHDGQLIIRNNGNNDGVCAAIILPVYF